MEDLDAEGDPWAISGLDFGEEPNNNDIDPWNCQHLWQRALFCPKEPAGEKGECHKCWKEVLAPVPLPDGYRMDPAGEIVATVGYLSTSGTEGIKMQTIPVEENSAYQCLNCDLIICRACKTASTLGGRS